MSEAIAQHTRHFVKFPETQFLHQMNIRRFYEIRHFPNVSSCVDGTHIEIKNPGGQIGEVFRNRKGRFSLNVQVYQHVKCF